MKRENSHPIQNFLKLLDDNDVLYACWKDLDLLSDVFDGKKDLDILASSKDAKKLIKLADDFGALILSNRFEICDDLIHIFLQGEGDVIYHVHVYMRLITGESWVKEYHLPIESKVLQKRVWDLNYKIWIIPKSLNQEFIILRYLMKITSLTSLYAYRKKRLKTKAHILKSKYGPSNQMFLNLSKLLNDHTVIIKSDKIKTHYFAALKVRRIFLKYRRLNMSSLFFQRLKGAHTKILKKYFHKEKKIFPSEGIILAITGVDGSGKSSLIANTESYYSKILTTRRSHIGRPYPNFINKFFQMFRGKNTSKNVSLSKETTSFLKSVFALCLAILRLHRARKITRLAKKGYLVLVDRWPTLELGKMDGPRIKVNETSNLHIWYLGKFERYIYKKIPSADICIILNVSLKEAQLRNSNRTKVNKESSQEIAQRYYQNSEFTPKSNNIVNYDNTSDFATAKRDIIKLSWAYISNK